MGRKKRIGERSGWDLKTNDSVETIVVSEGNIRIFINDRSRKGGGGAGSGGREKVHVPRKENEEWGRAFNPVATAERRPKGAQSSTTSTPGTHKGKRIVRKLSFG